MVVYVVLIRVVIKLVTVIMIYLGISASFCDGCKDYCGCSMLVYFYFYFEFYLLHTQLRTTTSNHHRLGGYVIFQMDPLPRC